MVKGRKGLEDKDNSQEIAKMSCSDEQEGNRKENATQEPTKQGENDSIRMKWGL